MIPAGLKAKLLGAMTAVTAVLGMILAAFLEGRRSKAREVQASTAKTIMDTTKRSRRIDEDIRATSADERRERLRHYASGPD